MFSVPKLQYDYDALSGYISADIMELHHDKHHQAYVDKLNQALEGYEDLASKSVEDLLRNLNDVPEEIRKTVRNNGGGHYNHCLFWLWMSPDGGGSPGGRLEEAIIAKYGSFDAFKQAFSDKAAGVFGSGWVWLQPDLEITTSSNQDSPLMNGGDEPILGLDVWEHAYYLDYKNKRPDYVDAWWHVVNWQTVRERYERLAQ
jgi:superoxide dismutase, Fe-Mn family